MNHGPAIRCPSWCTHTHEEASCAVHEQLIAAFGNVTVKLMHLAPGNDIDVPEHACVAVSAGTVGEQPVYLSADEARQLATIICTLQASTDMAAFASALLDAAGVLDEAGRSQAITTSTNADT
jgi:hypothetical protein